MEVDEAKTTRSRRSKRFQLNTNESKNSTEEKCEDVSYLCACSQFKTKDKILFMNHVKRCSPRERSLFCIRCYKYNLTPECLVKHIDADQCKPKSRSFNCGMCAFSTTKGVGLSEHIIKKHKDVLFKPCFYCQKEFSNLHCLMMHLDESICSPESKLNGSSTGAESLVVTPAKNNKTVEAKEIKNSCENSHKRPRGRPKKRHIVKSVVRERDSLDKTKSFPESKLTDSSTGSESLVVTPAKRNKTVEAKEIKKNCENSNKSSRGRPKKHRIVKSVDRERDSLDKIKSLPPEKSFNTKKPIESSTNQKNIKFDFQMSDSPYRLKSYHALTVFMKEPNICNFFKCMSLTCIYSTDSQQHFTNHITNNHSCGKQYCIYCCLDFDCESLAVHMVDVHGSRNHQCGECLYRCCDERYLTLHQSAHHNGTSKKFKCLLLKEKVKDEKSEELQPEYSCTMRKCVFSTKDPVDFVKHLKKAHLSESELSCPLCSENVKLSETAEEHANHYYNSHNYVFQCGHCDHGTRTQDGMWMHSSKEHADMQPRIYKWTSDDKLINCADDEKMFLPSISGSSNEISD